MRCLPVAIIAAFMSLPLAAQDDQHARWRIALGLGAGNLDFDEDNTARDDDATAGAFRLGFEGTSGAGFGGGLRLESFAASEMRLGAGTDYDVGMGSMFGHFTYRARAHRFAMPLRVGLLLNSLTLDNTAVDAEQTYLSAGLYLEAAPEFTLVRRGSTEWTLYGEAGLGSGSTMVEIDNDSREWDSSTGFAGLEFGTRLYLGVCELSAAFVSRWQSMDRTDPDGGVTLPGYDASFSGFWLGFGIVF
jgi:hypothetical protein